MNIVIDGYEANVPSRVGSGRFAFELIAAMHALVSARRDVYVSVVAPQTFLPDFPKANATWNYITSGPAKFWTFIGLPLTIARLSPAPQVVFSPTHYIPRFITQPRVMAIMDLSYIHYPQLFKPKDLYQLVNWTKYSVDHAAHIITISEFSKRAIIREYHVPDNKVTVVYPGLTVMADTELSFSLLQKRYSLSKNYILSVGTLQPRKNYERLIEAFSLFLKENKQKFRDIELVIVGKKGWLYEDILTASARFGVEKQVKFLDFIDDKELPALYKNALCLALPSLYEGFGLPVLEAMSYGCPVVVSETSSLPEIAGKAGVYVDPKSVDSIAKGLLSAVRQRNLIQGRNRTKLGRDRASTFTWENAAKKTLGILESVGGNP